MSLMILKHFFDRAPVMKVTAFSLTFLAGGSYELDMVGMKDM
jgi:hypothetical protein